jgi:hypothetical protein
MLIVTEGYNFVPVTLFITLLNYFKNENKFGISGRCSKRNKMEPLLNAAEIGVTVKDGIVSLTGVVDS